MKTILTTIALALLLSLSIPTVSAEPSPKPKTIKEHAGVKDIFMNIFDANLKNLSYLIQESQFLGVISHLEMHISELKITNLSSWIKDNTNHFIMVVMFENRIQASLDQELIFKSPIIPVFFQEELSKDVEGINHYLKRYKKPTISMKTYKKSENADENTKIYYYLLDTKEAKEFCSHLKASLNEDNIPLWCESKSNAVMSLLCYDIFCPKKDVLPKKETK
jgi:hypothetical protein